MKSCKKRFGAGQVFISLVVLAVAILLLAGCGGNDSVPGDAGNQKQQAGQNNDGRETETNENSGQEPDISAKPVQTKQKVTLYFGDDQAMYLVPEEREVTKGDETLETVIIRELIKGPGKEGLTRTIPEGVELLSVSVVDGVAYVNFSREFKTKHWGGSTGEIMTVYSVTNSLCKLPGIEKVQFLLEGDKEESILGNIGTMDPVEPNWDVIKK